MNRQLKFVWKMTTALCIGLVGLASPRAQAQAAPTYTLVDLGTLGGTKSYAQGINDSGQVTGYAFLAGDSAYHAFRYDVQTGMQDLGTLGGANSVGYGINASGQIAGDAMLANGAYHAVRWTGTTPRDIYPGSNDNSTARAINDAGHLTGNRTFASNSYQPTLSNAFLFDGGSVSEFSQWGISVGRGINNAGVIVGISDLMFLVHRILGLMRSSSGVLNPWMDEGEREYFAVNNNGVAVGRTYYSRTVGNPHDGFMTSFHPDYAAMWQNGVRTNLGVYGSVALAVNDSNQAVGVFDNKAVLFENRQTLDLNTLLPANSGWTLTEARGINNSGWIVGIGKHHGQDRAFLLVKDAVAQVSGTVNLQGVATSAASQTLTFTAHADGLHDVVRTVSVAPEGAFSISLPKRNGTLTIKGEKYLASRVNLDTTNGDVTNVTALLRAGDANNDNVADIADLMILAAAFNQTNPSVGYNAAADFNGDGANDILDLLLLIGNYNQIGD